MTTKHIEVPPRADRGVASDAAVEWDEPLTDWNDGRGDVGSAKSITSTMRHDSGGQIWVELRVGAENVYLRPENVNDFAWQLLRHSDWKNCHWDITLDACISKTCTFKPGSSHIGRLAPWQQMRTRRVVGKDRDPEILRLFDYGLTRTQIGIRVGWSVSTVSKVIREARQ